jgi:cell division protein FtsL
VALGPVVELPGPGRPRGIGVGGFLLALVTAGALAHVAVRLKGIEVAYDLGRERRINTELEEQRRRLHIEIGMLKDPVRVVALARDKLNMGPPAPGDIVRIRSGDTLARERVAPEVAPPPAKPRARSGPAAPGATAKSPRAAVANPVVSKPADPPAPAPVPTPAAETSASDHPEAEAP